MAPKKDVQCQEEGCFIYFTALQENTTGAEAVYYSWGRLTSNGCFNVKGTEQRHGVVLFQLKFVAQL